MSLMCIENNTVYSIDCNANEKCIKKTKKPYACTFRECGAVFSRPNRLESHIRTHNGERPFVCDWPNCQQSYTNQAHLRRHKKTVHDKQTTNERVPCSHCGRELANKYALSKHLKRKHDPNRKYPFSCSWCNRGFFRKKLLKYHITEHTGQYNFKCDTCALEFVRLVDYNRHLKSHRMHTCHMCNSAFNKWSLFLIHRRQCEADTAWKCVICKRKFASLVNFKLHKKKHETNKIKMYACNEGDCNRRYMHKRNLVYHISSSHKTDGGAQYACTYENCEVKLKHQASLSRHLIKYHGLVKLSAEEQHKISLDGTSNTKKIDDDQGPKSNDLVL